MALVFKESRISGERVIVADNYSNFAKSYGEGIHQSYRDSEQGVHSLGGSKEVTTN